MPTATIESRAFEFDDLSEIHDIWEKKEPKIIFPTLNNTIVNRTYKRKLDDKVVAYGSVKAFSEGILVLDKDALKREKAEVIKLCIPEMISRAKEAGLEYIYIISNDESYSKILRNKFNFLRVPGELLMISLKG